MRRFPSGRRCIRRRARRPLPGGNLSGKMALQALATYNRLYTKPFSTQTTFNREKNYIYLHRKNRKRKTTAKIYLRRNGDITACHESSRTGKVSDRPPAAVSSAVRSPPFSTSMPLGSVPFRPDVILFHIHPFSTDISVTARLTT